MSEKRPLLGGGDSSGSSGGGVGFGGLGGSTSTSDAAPAPGHGIVPRVETGNNLATGPVRSSAAAANSGQGDGAEAVEHTHHFAHYGGFNILHNQPVISALSEDVLIQLDLGMDFTDYPFPQPDSTAAGSVGLAAWKATGVGYLQYRAATTRLYPGQVMWLQDGSEQFVIIEPGLHYYPGPTRTLSAPVNLGVESVVLGNTTLVSIPNGRIGFCYFNNNVHILREGRRYILCSPLIHYIGSAPLNQQLIGVPPNDHMIPPDTLQIIRVQAGEFACVKDSEGHVRVFEDVGSYLLRAPEALLGVHRVTEARVFYEGYQRIRLPAGKLIFFQDFNGNTQYYDRPGTYELKAPAYFDEGFVDINQDLIAEGSVTLVRVKAGMLAVVQDPDGRIIVLTEPDRYTLRKPQRLLGVYSVNEGRIEHGTYERVRLQAGQLIFWQDMDGYTRVHEAPGTYELRRPAFFDAQIHDVNEPVIQFGSVVRVNLKRGQITFKYDAGGETVILDEPGVHIISRPEQYGGAVYAVSVPEVRLGAYTMINVRPKHVALTYDGRLGGADRSALRILGEGRHILDHELWVLREFRSVQEKRLDLKCTVYSRNRVDFAVESFILYKVVDPEKAFVLVENIEEELKREAEATILAVFGAHDSGEIYQGLANASGGSVAEAHRNATQSAGSEAAAAEAGGEAEAQQSFTDVVRDAFQNTIKMFAMERGVELTRMRIEHLDFADNSMKDAIQRQAEHTVRIEAERRNVVQKNQTLMLEARGKADAQRIEADGIAYAKQTETNAEVMRIRSLAKAQKEASNSPLATQLALIKAFSEGQAKVYSALGTKATVIPSSLSLQSNSLPDQISALLAGQAGLTDAMLQGVAAADDRDGEGASSDSDGDSVSADDLPTPPSGRKSATGSKRRQQERVPTPAS